MFEVIDDVTRAQYEWRWKKLKARNLLVHLSKSIGKNIIIFITRNVPVIKLKICNSVSNIHMNFLYKFLI